MNNQKAIECLVIEHRIKEAVKKYDNPESAVDWIAVLSKEIVNEFNEAKKQKAIKFAYYLDKKGNWEKDFEIEYQKFEDDEN
jgi:hypothetical protein